MIPYVKVNQTGRIKYMCSFGIPFHRKSNLNIRYVHVHLINHSLLSACILNELVNSIFSKIESYMKKLYYIFPSYFACITSLTVFYYFYHFSIYHYFS